MNRSHSLFREEAVQYRLGRKKPEVLLQCKPATQPLLFLLCACFLGLVFLINQIRYKEFESARGRLVTEEAEQQLVAPRDGLLQEILVAPGQAVQQGDTVALISQQLYDHKGRALSERDRELLAVELDALKQEKLLQRQVFTQGYASLEARAAGLQERIRIIAEGLETLREQEQISASLVEGAELLLENRSISQAQLNQQQLAHLDLMRERQLAENQLRQLQIDAEESGSALRALELEAQSQQNTLSKDIRLLALQLESVDSMTYLSVLATREGIVSSIPAEPGSAVRKGQALIYLQPQDQPLMAEVFVPSRILGKLAPGQDVMLRYDAFAVHSYGRYPATIDQIERAALDPRRHLLPAATGAEPMFRVLATPAQHYVEGEDIYPLQPGLQLSADFVGNELSLIQYIFKPLLNLKGRVS